MFGLQLGASSWAEHFVFESNQFQYAGQVALPYDPTGTCRHLASNLSCTARQYLGFATTPLLASSSDRLAYWKTHGH